MNWLWASGVRSISAGANIRFQFVLVLLNIIDSSCCFFFLGTCACRDGLLGAEYGPANRSGKLEHFSCYSPLHFVLRDGP